MSTSVLKALPGKLDIKRHSPSIPYLSYTNQGKVKCLISVQHNFLDFSKPKEPSPFVSSI